MAALNGVMGEVQALDGLLEEQLGWIAGLNSWIG